MKRFLNAQYLFVFSTLLILTMFSGPLAAQAPNLLANPGFENPFEAVAGNPPRQVAKGWTPWHISGGQSASENVQPEYYAASDVTNGLGVPRIRNGSEAQQYHSFFATHDGGLFQRVTGVTSGAQLRFSAYIYAWSSTFDDPNKSEDAGGIVVQVGIDPLGGTDGTSNSIVWSAPSIQYDAYNEYSVTATSTGTAVTVFVRSTVTTPVKNNNLYIDDAALVVATGGSASTSTSVPVTATKSVTATSTSVPPTVTSTTAPISASPTTGSGSSATTVPSSTTVPTTAAPAATATNTPVPPTVTPVPPTAASSPATATVAAPAPTATTAINPNDFPGRVVHIVQPGDTVGVLATVYGSTTDVIIQANGLTPSALIRVGQGLVIPVRLNAPATSTPTATPIAPVATATITSTGTGAPANSYVVQPGDTLGRIATRFNTTIATLAQLNGITNPNTIYVGQRLVIPGAGQVVSPATPAVVVVTATTAPPSQNQNTYVVQPGDTLFRIALRYRISMSQLAQANGISNFNRVFVGQVLVIP